MASTVRTPPSFTDGFDWRACLQRAASHGDAVLVEKLMLDAKGLYPEGFDDGRRIALQNAAGQGHLNIVHFLLSKNAKLDAIGTEAPALLRAVERNHLSIVHILLENGAHTEARDKFKRTVIFAAAAKPHIEALRLLLRFKADVNARDRDERNALIYVAAQDTTTRPPAREWTKESTETLVTIFSAVGIDLEAKDKTHRTALHWAASSGKVDMVRVLVSYCDLALVDGTHNRGRTPLHLATENHHTQVVRALLRGGADPHLANDGGWTALHIAAEGGFEDIANILLGFGVDVNAETKLGETPLHRAATNGHLAVTKLLLGHPHARRDKTDAAGSTPLVQAAQNHHSAIVQLLSSSTDGSHLPEFAVRACREYKAAVVNIYPEKTEKGRSAAVTRPSVFDLLYGRDASSGRPLISTVVEDQKAKNKKTQQFEPPFRWIHLPANNVC